MSYERTLKPFCKGTVETTNSLGESVQKSVTAQYLDSKILLVSGMNPEEVNRFEMGDGRSSAGIGKDILSSFRNGRQLFEWIVAAYAGKDPRSLEDMVALHFESELLPLLQGRRSKEAKRAIYEIITADKEIPSEELAKLKESYNTDSDQMFLAKSFIFSIIRDTLTDSNEYINPMVEQVLLDIQISKRSTLLNGLMDSIYECAVVGVTIFDTMPYTQEDVIRFVLGVLPIFDTLNESQKEKFINIRMRALEYEMNNEFKAGISKACNQLFKKYNIADKDFEVSRISWSDDANVLELQLKNTIRRPIVVWRADAKIDTSSPQAFAKSLGINYEDFEYYGFDKNDAIFNSSDS